MHLWKLFRYLPIQDLSMQVDGGSGGGSGGGSASGGMDHVDDLGSDLDILNGDDDDQQGDDEDGGEGNKGKDKGNKPRSTEGSDDDQDEPEDEDADKDGDNEEEEPEDEEDEDENKNETPEEKATREAEESKRVEGTPTASQLKATFKQFPGLRPIYFEHQKYSELFVDPQQAAESVEKAHYFDTIQQSVTGGDPKVFLKELSSNPEVYKPYIKNFLPTLRAMDEDTYLNVTEPIIAELLNHAAEFGKKHNNQNIIKSAKWIADFVYANGGEIPGIQKPDAKHPAEVELEKVRAEAATREQSTASNDVNSRIDKSLVGFITEGLDSRLSAIEKRYIVDASLNELITTLSKDANFGSKMKGLWARAKTSGFSEQAKATITSAHVARAKLALREIRERLSTEALKGRRRPKESDNNQEEKPKKRSFDTNGRGGATGRRESVLDSRKIDYSRTSDTDILFDRGGDRVKLKGQR